MANTSTSQPVSGRPAADVENVDVTQRDVHLLQGGALGRERMVHGHLGRTHPRWQSPHVAVAFQGALVYNELGRLVNNSLLIGEGEPIDAPATGVLAEG